MCKVFIYTIVFLTLTGVSLSLNLAPQNEWVPISKDEAVSGLSRLNKRFAYNPQNYLARISNSTKLKEEWAVPVAGNAAEDLDTDKILKKNAMKLVHPVKMIKVDQKHVFYPVASDTITSVNDLQGNLEENMEQAFPQNFLHTVAQSKEKHERKYNIDKDNIQNNSAIQRKPKAITIDRFTYTNIDNNKPISLTKPEIHSNNAHDEINQVTTQDNRKMYQVTEDAVDELQEEQSNTEERTGYFYIPPQHSHDNPMGNNITNLFLDILSKHNIRPDDNLPNYSLSRRQKNRNPLNGYMLIAIPLKAISHFSNLNLDPLAVLLSNYGFYLPGSYGIRGKYRNLYSYLASNNIHNNKPFGAYKIFSDTDSSN